MYQISRRIIGSHYRNLIIKIISVYAFTDKYIVLVSPNTNIKFNLANRFCSIYREMYLAES